MGNNTSTHFLNRNILPTSLPLGSSRNGLLLGLSQEMKNQVGSDPYSEISSSPSEERAPFCETASSASPSSNSSSG